MSFKIIFQLIFFLIPLKSIYFTFVDNYWKVILVFSDSLSNAGKPWSKWAQLTYQAVSTSPTTTY